MKELRENTPEHINVNIEHLNDSKNIVFKGM